MRTADNEPVVFYRDVRGVMVPAGAEVTLKAGQAGYITQALGGSFTVYVDGSLFRIAGEDADALGKEVVKPVELPPHASDEDVLQAVWEQLATCYDPEIPINIVDLGLVYECGVRVLSEPEDPKPARGTDEEPARAVDVKLTLTAPGCGMGDILVDDAKDKLERVPTVQEVNVELVFDPPWNPSMMSEAARLQTGMY
ncbi:MAG: putative Fe-S cluster assembly protein SufT [Steroidobacteraceae bacterium]